MIMQSYAKLWMSPSLDGTLPEYVISQEDNRLHWLRTKTLIMKQNS